MKVGGPRDATIEVPGGLAILSFQITVRRRFERLAARKNRRLPQKSILEARSGPKDLRLADEDAIQI
jgi:hypothetical protein